MKTSNSIMMIEKTKDSLSLASYQQLNPVVDTDTTEFVAVTECNPNPVFVNVKDETNWFKDNFSVWVAIGTFVLTWLLTRGFKNLDERRERERYRKAVLKWIDLMQLTESGLINSVMKLSETMSKSDDMQPVAFQMPNTIPDKIKDLSVESMMDAFGRGNEKEKRNWHLYNIIGQFDYLTKMNVEIRKEYERYNSQAFSLCNEWNQVFRPFADTVERCQNIEIKKVFIQWMNELEKKPNNSGIHVKYLDEIDNLINEPNYAIDEMKRIITQSQAYREGFAKLFHQMAARMVDSMNALKEAASFFREHSEKKKWFCR